MIMAPEEKEKVQYIPRLPCFNNKGTLFLKAVGVASTIMVLKFCSSSHLLIWKHHFELPVHKGQKEI